MSRLSVPPPRKPFLLCSSSIIFYGSSPHLFDLTTSLVFYLPAHTCQRTCAIQTLDTSIVGCRPVGHHLVVTISPPSQPVTVPTQPIGLSVHSKKVLPS
ncbi:uncharacterized protein LAJ45_04919 [Morchella importuna]|uniref:uncharacterized protein n=1 Tax=Morchella importuna TaxID=1174673 RepID=UPI001E8EE0CB|nr:uncharacterized protein LAJ45_04919 [Morchella importuna]KAH8151217.1 hypothetical protein LAJ45_04919 [Morchella importuna]